MAFITGLLENWSLNGTRNGSLGAINISSVGTPYGYVTTTYGQGVAYTGAVGRYDTFAYSTAIPAGSISFDYTPIGAGSGTAHRLIGKTQVGITDVFVISSVNTGKRLQVLMADTLIYVDSGDRFVAGNTYNITITWNGTTITGDVNNVQVFSVSSAVGVNADATLWTIGGWAGNTTQQPDCIIDNINIWTRPLTAAERLTIGYPYPYYGINTDAITNLTTTSVTLNGNIPADGGSTITERGFVFSTVTNPTIADLKLIVSGTTGSYLYNLTGLTPNTTYYVRAYFINSLGTIYGSNVSFTTPVVSQYDIQKNINAITGQTYIGSINVTGTVGTITVKLGSTGSSTVINAGAGVSQFSGTYSGTGGLIITRSSNFNGTIDNVYYANVPLATSIDWSQNTTMIVSAINSSVFFKRIEDDVFNTFRLYRYLDLLFKDFDGYVTVTLRSERNDAVYTKERTFLVGNTSDPASPFSKKRISFLCKDQAIIIGVSNASLNETFALAKFVLSGHKRQKKMFDSDRIVSVQ